MCGAANVCADTRPEVSLWQSSLFRWWRAGDVFPAAVFESVSGGQVAKDRVGVGEAVRAVAVEVLGFVLDGRVRISEIRWCVETHPTQVA
jgi:hypothetical protein